MHAMKFMGSGSITQLILILSTRWRQVPTLPIEWRLCESWSRSRCIREEKNLLFLQGIELQFLGCPAHSHITMLTSPWSMDTNVLVLNYVPCQSHFISVNF
jgi:hypothetical protein